MNDFIDEVSMEELEPVVFAHDTLAASHSKHRKQNAKNKRKSRGMFTNAGLMTDVKFTKKQLHRYNRRHPEIPATLYYKNPYSIASVEYGLT